MVAQTVAQSQARHKQASRSERLARVASRIALWAAILVLAAAFSLPFFWSVFTSLKTPFEIFVFPPKWFPALLQWGNYIEIFRQAPLGTFLVNSAIVTILSMVGSLVSASLVAYGFARFRFPGRDNLFIVVLATLMLPGQVTIIPQFLMFKSLGWLDTLKPLIVPAYFGGGAFAIFLFRQFFLTIPKEFDEAAKMDGANSLWIFIMVLMPLAKSVFVTMAIFSFMGAWNDFFGPLIFLNSPEHFTMALGLSHFARIATAGGAPTEHLLMAAAMVMTFPSLLIFVLLQKYFTQGIVMSGLKG